MLCKSFMNSDKILTFSELFFLRRHNPKKKKKKEDFGVS